MVMQSPEKLNHQCNVLLLPGVSKQEVQNFDGEIQGSLFCFFSVADYMET